MEVRVFLESFRSLGRQASVLVGKTAQLGKTGKNPLYVPMLVKFTISVDMRTKDKKRCF